MLKKAGWPTTVVVVDFECYFSKTYRMLKKGGTGLPTICYVMDPRFESLGVGTVEMDGKLPFSPRQSVFWHDAREQFEYLQGRYGENLEGCVVAGWNLRFDGTVLARKHGIVPRYAIDIMALSQRLDARAKHNLRDVCERHGLPPKGDTMEFEGLHWADMDEEKRKNLAIYCNNDVEREADLLVMLLPELDRPEVELPLIWHTQRLFWEPDLDFDAAEADRLIGLMGAQVAVDCGEWTPKEIGGVASFSRLLGEALAETGESIAMKQGKKKMIVALAKDDEALKAYRVHSNPRVRALIKARTAVKSWPLHIGRLVSMSKQAKASGGRLCNPIKYNGAHTGRWTGGEGINTYNLPTRGTGLQVEMKHCLRAPEGHILVMGDAAQIEARGTAWLAGQTDLIEAFTRDEDVYSQFAAEVLAAPCRKPRKSDPPPVAKLYGARRAIGKVGILGMGYNMGPDRCMEYMQTYPELEPKVASGEIDFLFCKNLVDAYRSKYYMIPRFWRSLEDVFRFTTRYGTPQTVRGLGLSRDGSTTVVTLPSGRRLFYPHAAVDVGGDLRYHWGKLYGGILTENIVQAMSRDVLVEALLFVEERGFRVAHHVYDSLVVVAKETEDTLAYSCVTEALKQVPAWATGWPMGAEVTLGKRYD
jgi:DNA polymerase